MTLLEDSIDAMILQTSIDNSDGDFSVKLNLQRLISNLKDKLSITFGRKKDTQASVIKACYDYLEENGYDAYPVLLDILNNQRAVNANSDMSELAELSDALDKGTDNVVEMSEDDLVLKFAQQARQFSNMDVTQKKQVKEELTRNFGPDVAKSYVSALEMKAPEVQVPKKTIGIFAILGVLYFGYKLIKSLTYRPSKIDESGHNII